MNLYLLFKSLHLIAVISWMAGLLYLPRIFVYHSEASNESQKDVFKIMERKLYNYIMMPAMLLYTSPAAECHLPQAARQPHTRNQTGNEIRNMCM